MKFGKTPSDLKIKVKKGFLIMTNLYPAIIPADVRYDKDLPANAKLLYGELTVLCQQKGYCWATNSYFAKIYDVDIRTVKRWLSALKEKGYIFYSTQDNFDTPQDTNVPYPRQICLPPRDNFVTQNKKNKNKKNKFSRACAREDTQNEDSSSFDLDLYEEMIMNNF